MSDSHLNIQSLFGAQTLKQKKEKEVFEKIVSRCHQKIKSCAEFKKYNCIFDIPKFIIGEIMYDFNRSRNYLIQRLKNEKFIVREYQSNLTRLYICWDYESLIKEHKHINLPKRDDIFEYQKPKVSAEPKIQESSQSSKKTIKFENKNETSNTKKIIPYRPTGIF